MLVDHMCRPPNHILTTYFWQIMTDKKSDGYWHQYKNRRRHECQTVPQDARTRLCRCRQ